MPPKGGGGSDFWWYFLPKTFKVFMVFFGGKKQTIWHKNKLNTTIHFFAPLLGSAHSKICIFLDDKNLVKPVFQRLNVCHPWDPNQTPEQLAQECWNFDLSRDRNKMFRHQYREFSELERLQNYLTPVQNLNHWFKSSWIFTFKSVTQDLNRRLIVQ